MSFWRKSSYFSTTKPGTGFILQLYRDAGTFFDTVNSTMFFFFFSNGVVINYCYYPSHFYTSEKVQPFTIEHDNNVWAKKEGFTEILYCCWDDGFYSWVHVKVGELCWISYSTGRLSHRATCLQQWSNTRLLSICIYTGWEWVSFGLSSARKHIFFHSFEWGCCVLAVVVPQINK